MYQQSEDSVQKDGQKWNETYKDNDRHAVPGLRMQDK